jgi:1-acyl-sn-glycerol-3-phosphate acyltransferase
MGIELEESKIRENIDERDKIDSTRKISPLLKPPGARVIDTSNISIDQQVQMAEEYARRRAREISESETPGHIENRSLFFTSYFRTSSRVLLGLLKLLFGLSVHGEENLRNRGNFIFASNHISYADPPVVGSALNREVWFLAKKELFNNRFFGWLIRKYHAVPIDRDSFDRSAIRRVITLLKSGQSILMFPEGTRSRDDSLKMPKIGLGYIALNSNSNIIPVFVSGTNRMGGALLRREKLEVYIGPPIYIDSGYESDDRKKDYQLISSMVFEVIRMLKNEY